MNQGPASLSNAYTKDKNTLFTFASLLLILGWPHHLCLSLFRRTLAPQSTLRLRSRNDIRNRASHSRGHHNRPCCSCPLGNDLPSLFHQMDSVPSIHLLLPTQNMGVVTPEAPPSLHPQGTPKAQPKLVPGCTAT